MFEDRASRGGAEPRSRCGLVPGEMAGSELYLQLQNREKHHAESAEWVCSVPGEAAESGELTGCGWIILTKDLSADYTDWRRVGESMFLICVTLRQSADMISIRLSGNHAASATFGIRSSTLENMGDQWTSYSPGIQTLRGSASPRAPKSVLRALRVLRVRSNPFSAPSA
jgi:hypothetical protein